MEFVAKKKTLKISIDGVSHEMRCPTLGEREELVEKLKGNEDKAFQMYADWFETMGLPKSALYSMDADDFVEFIEFVTNPKKKHQN
jgi:hypothetical protein